MGRPGLGIRERPSKYALRDGSPGMSGLPAAYASDLANDSPTNRGTDQAWTLRDRNSVEVCQLKPASSSADWYTGPMASMMLAARQFRDNPAVAMMDVNLGRHDIGQDGRAVSDHGDRCVITTGVDA